MKALVISLIIFTLLSVALFANFVYVNNTADSLHSLAKSLTLAPSGKDALDKLEAEWSKASLVFGLSVNSKEINAMDETLLSLRSAYTLGREYEFEHTKALLIDCINDLRRLERFSVKNIL